MRCGAGAGQFGHSFLTWQPSLSFAGRGRSFTKAPSPPSTLRPRPRMHAIPLHLVAALLACGAFVAAPPASAQRAEDFAPHVGKAVRVEWRAEGDSALTTRISTLAAMRGDTLVLGFGYSERLVPVGQVTQASWGDNRQVRGFFAGLLGGLVAGPLLGAGIAAVAAPECTDCWISGPVAGAIAGLFYGPIVGGVAGFVAAPRRWRTIPLTAH